MLKPWYLPPTYKKSNLLLKHCHSISLLRVGSLKLILSKNISQIEVNLIQARFLSKKESRYGCDTLTKCTRNMQSIWHFTSRACACVLPVLIRIVITLYGLRAHLCRCESEKGSKEKRQTSTENIRLCIPVSLDAYRPLSQANVFRWPFTAKVSSHGGGWECYFSWLSLAEWIHANVYLGIPCPDPPPGFDRMTDACRLTLLKLNARWASKYLLWSLSPL